MGSVSILCERATRRSGAPWSPRVNRAYFTRSGFVASRGRQCVVTLSSLGHASKIPRLADTAGPGHAYGRKLGHPGNPVRVLLELMQFERVFTTQRDTGVAPRERQ